MNEELKLCPFCDTDKLRLLRDSSGNIALVNCVEHTIPMSPERWQSRPIEDALQGDIDATWNTRPIEDALLKQLDEWNVRDKHNTELFVDAQDQITFLRKQVEIATEALKNVNHLHFPEDGHIVHNYHDICPGCQALDALAEIERLEAQA